MHMYVVWSARPTNSSGVEGGSSFQGKDGHLVIDMHTQVAQTTCLQLCVLHQGRDVHVLNCSANLCRIFTMWTALLTYMYYSLAQVGESTLRTCDQCASQNAHTPHARRHNGLFYAGDWLVIMKMLDRM